MTPFSYLKLPLLFCVVSRRCANLVYAKVVINRINHNFNFRFFSLQQTPDVRSFHLLCFAFVEKNTFFCRLVQITYDTTMSHRHRYTHSYQAASRKTPRPVEFSHHFLHMDCRSQVVSYRTLHKYDDEDEYYGIADLINYDPIVITRIVAVDNPYLKKAYLLKRSQKEYYSRYGVEEVKLLHGTKRSNVHDICQYNFNWRFRGYQTGHKFGQGVSFSACAKYASFYSVDDYKKVMLVAKVLIEDECIGNSSMVVPPRGYDTSIKSRHNRDVVVKYDDSEFYPTYKIYYNFDFDSE